MSLIFKPQDDYLMGEETGGNLEACFCLKVLRLVLSLTGTDLCNDSKPCSDLPWEASQPGRLPLALAG